MPNSFRRKLRSLRESAGLTPTELAAKARLSRAMVYALEAGTRKPTFDTVLALCKALGCELSAFDPFR